MFGKADAKICHFLLTEATVIRKISWLTDMRRLCVTFHFGTKQTIEFWSFGRSRSNNKQDSSQVLELNKVMVLEM